MTVFREAAVVVFFTAVAAVGTHYLHPRAPQWYLAEEPLKKDEVTMDLIARRWKGNVLWIDARLRSQYEAGHVPGALLLNEQEADQLMIEHFSLLQDNTKPIVVYCSSEACQASRKIAGYLKERLPTEDVYVLRGGWGAWQADSRSAR